MDFDPAEQFVQLKKLYKYAKFQITTPYHEPGLEFHHRHTHTHTQSQTDMERNVVSLKLRFGRETKNLVLVVRQKLRFGRETINRFLVILIVKSPSQTWSWTTQIYIFFLNILLLLTFGLFATSGSKFLGPQICLTWSEIRFAVVECSLASLQGNPLFG